MNSLKEYVQQLGTNAKMAASSLGTLSTSQKNTALQAIKTNIVKNIDSILQANLIDVNNALANKLDHAFVDRLTLSKVQIELMIEGIEQITKLADPIGEMFDLKPMPSGINVGKMRVPLGVVGIIYESRPNVTIDATALCIKSGNAVILRGGSEAFHTNQALAKIIESSILQSDLPQHCVQIVNTRDREAVGYMLQLKDKIDVIIPRGGNALVARIDAESKIPVIKHLDGICHTFVDKDADLTMALAICDNAKTQRYAPCNTMETLLIDTAIALDFLPMIAKVYQEKGVEIRGCKYTESILKDHNIVCQSATEQDWYTEYMAPIISIKIVSDMQDAIHHINHYGSHHTDVIVTNHHRRAMQFLRSIDSASVMVNASSRFTDGFEFGLGAEIGISTDKLHVRGPVGLEGLTSVKYIVLGDGQVRG